MQYFSLDDNLAGLYVHAMKVTNWKKKEFSILGNRYGEIKNLPLGNVCLYIDRELFLAMRRGILPSLEYSIKASPEPISTEIEGGHISTIINKCEYGHILIREDYLRKMEGGFLDSKEVLDGYFSGESFQDLLSPDALEIQFTIAQLLMAYNQESYALSNGRLELASRHFDYSVEFSRRLLENTLPPSLKVLKRQASNAHKHEKGEKA